MPKNPIKHIIHIDDDEEDFLMLREAIKAVHSEAEVFFLSECPSRVPAPGIPTPDMIFLDINMHSNDGFYWLERIRAQGYTHLPIIMYSTANTDTYISKAYSLGANLFFIKPHTFNELTDSLRHIFSLNWSAPDEITRAHFYEGKYHPLRLN